MEIDKAFILNAIKEQYSFKKDADFARFLEIKPQTLSTWYTRNTFDIELLYAKCELIDGNFLLTGKGNILRNSNQTNEKSASEEEKEKEIERLKDKNADLQTINDLYKRTLEDMDRKNSTLQYIGREPTIFDNVVESKPELIKKTKNDEAKK